MWSSFDSRVQAREQEELVNARESMKSLSEKNAQLYNDVMHAEVGIIVYCI